MDHLITVGLVIVGSLVGGLVVHYHSGAILSLLYECAAKSYERHFKSCPNCEPPTLCPKGTRRLDRRNHWDRRRSRL